jgi:hypothetical protein
MKSLWRKKAGIEGPTLRGPACGLQFPTARAEAEPFGNPEWNEPDGGTEESDGSGLHLN